jgi:hypothetical protein
MLILILHLVGSLAFLLASLISLWQHWQDR